MTIELYNNSSENIALNKYLELLTSVEGYLRDESSIIDPIIEVEDIDNQISRLNYAHIEYFGRYYFIDNIESVRTGVWRLYMHVDVLQTYREQILENTAIIGRNENEYDLLLNDGLFVTQQNPRIAQFPFPSGFNTWNFVLAVAGN